jgi:pimeloyl-ACP methyl ester carboxylesterase
MQSSNTGITGYHLHGKKPARIAVIHGGPGAPGSVCGIAKQLARDRGVLEPFQTKSTIQGLVTELRDTIITHGAPPAVLIGHSWGAWLSLIFAASHPSLVRSLILVGSGPFKEEYVPEIEKRRISRLSANERNEYSIIRDILEHGQNRGSPQEKDGALVKLAELVSKTDYVERSDTDTENALTVRLSGEMYESVWKEASDMRRSGRLLLLCEKIRCPVVAIHGEQDPHPAEGVKDVLAPIIRSFEFYSLDRCGHYPWQEKYAKDTFYEIVASVLNRPLATNTGNTNLET